MADDNTQFSSRVLRQRRQVRLAAAVIVIVAVTAACIWLLCVGRPAARMVPYQHTPDPVFGADCEITVVVPQERTELARKALKAAEAALRDVEGRMSAQIEGGELWNLNAAAAGVKTPLSPLTLEVLRTSRQLHAQSRGAFDITVLPLVKLWRQGGRDNLMPTAAQLAEARAQSSWDQIKLLDDGAVKDSNTACCDLGGIAWGFAADRAVMVLLASGADGGMVEVGGTIRYFGRPTDEGLWMHEIPNPFQPQGPPIAAVRLDDGAVSAVTGGGRFNVIQGRRYSAAIDPNTGLPVSVAASVTVVAPTAMLAQGWSTALSVLGPEGLDRIPPKSGIEAMFVVGSASNYTCPMTEGFSKLLVAPVRLGRTAPLPRPAVEPSRPATAPATTAPSKSRPAAASQPTKPSSKRSPKTSASSPSKTKAH